MAADPKKVKRCYYCGAKKTETARWKNGKRTAETQPTIFHKPGCKLAEEKDPKTGKSRAETEYPGICHGGYVTL